MKWTKEQLQSIVDNYSDDREYHYIQAHSGKKVDYSDLQVDSIDIMDIAHALSNNCRFNGHTSSFFSVAQHSLLVEAIVAEAGGTLEQRMQALLHDAPEAYISDMPTPLKSLLPFFKAIERTMEIVISRALEVDIMELDKTVKQADHKALAIEAHNFFDKVEWIENPNYKRCIAGVSDPSGKLVSLPPSVSKEAFLNKYWNLRVKLDKEEHEPSLEVSE